MKSETKTEIVSRYTRGTLIVLLIILTAGTFVMATAAGEDVSTQGKLSGTEQIDALVKSILDGVESDDPESGTSQAGQAGSSGGQTEKAAPKRSVILDDDEILEAVEVVGEISEGSRIQAITFNKEMTIADALRFLALKYQKNIIPSPEVDGMITITNLYNVSFEQALEAIIGPNKYEIDGDFIRIYTPEEYYADSSRMVSEIMTLHYITAAEAENLLKPVLSESGQIASTTPALLDTVAGEGGDTLAQKDTIVLKDYPEVIKEAKRVLEGIDVPPLQILIEVTILEATLNETTQFGLDWSVLGLGQEGTLGSSSFNQTNFTDGISGGLSIGILNGNLELLIQAIEEITDTTILANPKILALNKQAGKLLIGDQTGYKTTSVSDGIQTETVDFMESGTLLEFRPFVCSNGLIRMEIHPEQSEATYNATTQAPDKSTTTVQTNILVKDGKTIVLGGLFKEKTNLTRSQIPLLGDIPILGHAFRGTNDESERVELIVLITPHIIKDPEETAGAERLDEVRMINNDARHNIAMISRARFGEELYKRAVEDYQNGDLKSAMNKLNLIAATDRIYLDAEKLRERIVRETQPENIDRIERIMLDNVEKSGTEKWLRH